MKRYRSSESEETLDDLRIRRRLSEERSEERYLIEDLPKELLLLQLSDTGITLNDIESFSATNRRIRQLCKTDPLFIKLKEGKRVAVHVGRDFDGEYGITIYSYLGQNVIVNQFNISSSQKGDLEIVLDLLVEEPPTVYMDKHFVEFDDKRFLREGNRGLIKPSPGDYVRIGLIEDHENSFGPQISLPYDLFRTIILEMENMNVPNAYGNFDILVNGDIIYHEYLIDE